MFTVTTFILLKRMKMNLTSSEAQWPSEGKGGVLKSTIEHPSNCNVTNQHQKRDSILKKYIFGCAALVPVLVITQIVQYILKYNIILIKIVRGPSGKKKP